MHFNFDKHIVSNIQKSNLLSCRKFSSEAYAVKGLKKTEENMKI